MKTEIVLSNISDYEGDDSGSSHKSSPPRAAGGWSPKSVFQRLARKLSPSNSTNSNRSLHLNNDHTLLPLSNTAISKHRELQRVFYCFDEDGDGKISPAELQSCVRTIGGELSTADAQDIVTSTDTDGDGLLGFDDFVKLMKADGEEEEKKDLIEAFRMYEMEGSGSITPKSLKKMLTRLGEAKTTEECKAIISSFDLNEDGVLSFEEFRIMMR
ncbi:hypothetical protein GIB67_025434 [Kingdonia uniflora]|uniref:EF-hand domain-containing protein n=1 Tax=Kingdonia uniflora TaxID=39325 RepID=A0A7J7N129_9MAGN|nr:hypothetical protein GIB67_025434 [Kingdonia uniflora]